MFSSNVRNQWVPQAHNVAPTSTSTSGKEKRMEKARQLQRPPQLAQTSRPHVALFSKISSPIQQPRHSWHHPAGLKGAFHFSRRPRNSAPEVSVLCLGTRQAHT